MFLQLSQSLTGLFLSLEDQMAALISSSTNTFASKSLAFLGSLSLSLSLLAVFSL